MNRLIDQNEKSTLNKRTFSLIQIALVFKPVNSKITKLFFN